MNIIIPIDLLEEIFLGLPLKSILIFKTVSKHWRSILESRSFAERRMKDEKKNPKILSVGDHRFKLDAGEIEVVCLLAAKRPSLTCEGLVCLPVPGCVNVLNPSTGEYISFASGIDLVTKRFDGIFFVAPWWNIFPGYWAMGFGKDQVNGNYKVVRMKSVCVNGSIYWLEMLDGDTILALDLHTEKFCDVPVSPESSDLDQLVNFQNNLRLRDLEPFNVWFRPVAV
ncbi:unnamed protein product [Brassica oleracea]